MSFLDGDHVLGLFYQTLYASADNFIGFDQYSQNNANV